MNQEKIAEFHEHLGGVASQETIDKLAAMIPDNVPPSSVVPIVAGIVKRLPQGLSPDEILNEVRKQMSVKQKDHEEQAAEQPGSARMMARKYFDSMLVEMRLMGAVEPSTHVEIFGQTFASPIMTAALSHMSLYRKGVYGPSEYLAQGASAAGCLHWVGMTDNDHFEQIIETEAKLVRVVKPYADEDKIFAQIQQADELGAIAVGMDIDHVITTHGDEDVAMGEKLGRKTLEQMKSYVCATKLPFIVKGVLSVRDALRCAEIGADGVLISNHGGRLPFVLPPLMVLPEIKKAVGKDLKVFVDGSVSSGMDVYKAMALGADAVGVGAHLVPLVRKGGTDAVEKRLREMTAELKGAMAFTGVSDCRSFDSSVIHMRAF